MRSDLFWQYVLCSDMIPIFATMLSVWRKHCKHTRFSNYFWILLVCVKVGAWKPPKRMVCVEVVTSRFCQFSLFRRDLNRKKGFRAAIWNWTCDSHQLCALDFQRSQLKNATVKIPSTCVKIGVNDVIYRQNKGKWRHLPSNYRQNGLHFS